MSLHDETVESIHELVLAHGDYDELYDGDRLGVYVIRIQRTWNFGDRHERGIIFTLTDPTQSWLSRHFEMSGYYSSWGSSDWEGPLREVVAVEQLVTFYAPKEGFK